MAHDIQDVINQSTYFIKNYWYFFIIYDIVKILLTNIINRILN